MMIRGRTEYAVRRALYLPTILSHSRPASEIGIAVWLIIFNFVRVNRVV